MRNALALPLANSWHKLPNETRKSYAAFVAYYSLPPSVRSVEKAAKAIGKNSRWLEAQAGKFHWVARSSDYDSHVEQMRIQAQEAAFRKFEENRANLVLEQINREMEQAKLLEDKAVAVLKDTPHLRKIAKRERRENDGQTIIENVTIEPAGANEYRAATEMLKTAQSMMRRALSMPVDSGSGLTLVQNNFSVGNDQRTQNVNYISQEERDAMIRRYIEIDVNLTPMKFDEAQNDGEEILDAT